MTSEDGDDRVPSILHFPLVCWKLPGGSVLGCLVGTDYELVAADAKKIVTALGDRLRRDAEAGDPLFPEPIENPRLKVLEVLHRPAYREGKQVFPSPAPVPLRVVLVHGENDFGSCTCFLPELRGQFTFHQPGQLEVLAAHFVRIQLGDLDPERVHRYLGGAEPWLVDVPVRTRRRRREKGPGFAGAERMHALEAVADRFPFTKRERRQMALSPAAAWERETEVKAAAAALLRDRANLLLVGEPGVGKSAILREAARQVHAESRKERRGAPVLFWRTTPHRLIAGAKYLGDWQAICDTVVEALEATDGILWIEDFAGLLQAGGRGAEDSIAAYLAPALDRGEIRIVSEATPRALEAFRSRLPGFAERFRILDVAEMGEEAARKVEERFGEHARRNLGVSFRGDALEAAFRLLRRYVQYDRFPGKAVKFLAARLNEAVQAGRTAVRKEDVLEAFSLWTGFPEVFLRDDLPLDAAEVKSWFASRIVGQGGVLDRLVRVVETYKAGMNDPARPVAALLFAGPTGVGKTATARALAEYFFGAGQQLHPLVRADMSEFQTAGQVERLIGSGGGDPGKFIREIRERPFSVVLFDEIEKAHPVFFDVLLGVLDEGVLVDAWGRETDFRNSILIMTSNLGTRRGSSLGFGEEPAGRLEGEVRSFFRPEFFNRIDQVLEFGPLAPEAVAGIASKELRELAAREGFRKRGLRVEFTEALVSFVASAGFDPIFGARPLQRLIEREVTAPLARFLLGHRHLRDRTFRVDRQGDEVLIETT